MELSAGATFTCSCIEEPDHRAVVTRLQAEGEVLSCDLNQARRWHHPLSQEDVIWVARQSPGWVRIFTLSGSSMWWALDSLPQPGGRAFYLSYDKEIGRMSDPVYVSEGSWQDIPEDYWGPSMEEGAHLVGSSRTAKRMNLFLAVMAYTTGRFIDDAWFTTPGLLCRIPDGTWAHE
jgi:hypothetical protein